MYWFVNIFHLILTLILSWYVIQVPEALGGEVLEGNCTVLFFSRKIKSQS